MLLFKQLKMCEDGYVRDEDELFAVKALRALVAGYERIPWQEPIHQTPPRGEFR